MTKTLDTTKLESKLIAYIRVSTQRQGESGLGLEAQQASIGQYAQSIGGIVIQTYREVESGRKNDRPELLKAIAHAKRIKARLVIAKLDRLARNVQFISSIMESRVDFVACDNPHANKLTIHILAAVAEDEADRISQRTKAALAAAKARGTKLGSARPGHWDGREHLWVAAQKKASAAFIVRHRAESAPLYDQVKPIIADLRLQGVPYGKIAMDLNGKGFATIKGRPWNKVQVMRLAKAS